MAKPHEGLELGWASADGCSSVEVAGAGRGSFVPGEGLTGTEQLSPQGHSSDGGWDLAIAK